MAAQGVAGLLGPAVATYAAVLVSDTAVPVWHEARREPPFVFASGATACAGAAGPAPVAAAARDAIGALRRGVVAYSSVG